jgi:hypothetical protein
VNFSTITLCVASKRVFIVVVISLPIQSGNFWCILLAIASRSALGSIQTTIRRVLAVLSPRV